MVSHWISLLFSHHTRATILSLRVADVVSVVDGVILDILVATQFLTHVLIIFQKNPKNTFLNIFALFLEFLALSQKNLNFKRSW